MLRSCLLMLALYAALFAGYYYWIGPQFDPPWVYVGVGAIALVVAGCVGALINARTYYRDWSLLSAARHNLPWVDGRWTAVCGEIHPLAEPLVAPFSGEECVMCEYDAARASRRSSSSGEGSAGSDFAGFLMNPCTVRTKSGDIRLLGFPNLDAFAERHCDSYEAARNAAMFFASSEFEDLSGLKLVTIVSAIQDAWKDDDGLVRKNLRLGKLQPAGLFPRHLMDVLEKLPAAEPAAADEVAAQPPDSAGDASQADDLEQDDPDDEFDDDEFDDDEFDDDEFDDDEIDDDDFDDDDLKAGDLEDDLADDEDLEAYSTALPVLKEKRVRAGEKVCAIGIYSAARGGLIPGGLGADHFIKLMRGGIDAAERRARGSVFSHLLGGLIVLVVVNAATYGVVMANRHHPASVDRRQHLAFGAVRDGDAARLGKLLSRGLDVNVRESGKTMLHVAQSAACTRVLLARGANPNALSDEGRTPLMEAAYRGHEEVLPELLAAKADVNLVCATTGQSALDYAIRGGHDEVAGLLRAAGGREALPAQPPPDR